MSVIGNIAVMVSANAYPMQLGLRKAADQLQGFGAKVSGVASSLAPLGSAVAGLAGAAGLGALLKASLDNIDAMSKLGSSLGISLDQVAGLQHAADLSGVSFEELTAAMNRLARNGKNIYEVADAMAAMKNPSEVAKYAFDTLGKSGQKLVPLLSGGSAALREMVDEGSRLSGLKGVDGKDIEAANDAWTRVSASIKGAANVIVVELAPAIEAVAVVVQKIAEDIRGWSAALAVGSDVTAGIAANAAKAAVAEATIAGSAKTVATETAKIDTEKMEKLAKAADSANNRMQSLRDEIQVLAAPEAMRPYVEIGQELRKMAEAGAPQASIDGVKQLLVYKQQLLELQKAESDALKEQEKAMKKIADEAKREAEEIQRREEERILDLKRAAQDLFDAMQSPAEKLADKLEQIQEMRKEGIIGKADADKLSKFVQDQFDKEQRKSIEPLGSVGAVQRGSAESFSAIFSAMRQDGGGGIDAVAKTSKEQLAEAKKQTAALRRQQRDNPNITLVQGAI